MRTAVAVADAGQFQEAAAELAITQQAVSKRVAALERQLGVRLFTRTARGAQLTGDGQAFLPHARELLRAAERAAASVRPGSRKLRVDVIRSWLAPAGLLRAFHRAHPDTDLDVVTLFGADAAFAAVRSGSIDASFRAVVAPPDGIATVRVHNEPLQLLTGPDHPLAACGSVRPADLAGHRIWMPAIVDGTEWATFYAEFATTFGFTIDADGPDFGTESLMDVVAGSATLATFVGSQTRLVWPAGHDLRRIDLHDPAPVYPHSLVWRRDNPHPALATLRGFLGVAPGVDSGVDSGATGTWTPRWAAG